MSWSRKLFNPIPLPDGRMLITLRDAGDYISSLSKAEQRKEHWQAAAHALILVAENGGDVMLPWTGMLQALNHGKPDKVKESRKKRMKQYRVVR